MSSGYRVSEKRTRNRLNIFTCCPFLIRKELPDDLVMSTAAAKNSVLIYGGCGAVGSKCIQRFKGLGYWWVVSVDYTVNIHADVNIILEVGESMQVQQEDLMRRLESVMAGGKLDVVLCLASKASSSNDNLVSSMAEMLNGNVWSALICTTVATKYLRTGGLYVLSGAKTGVLPTPHTIPYGMTKAAVHHLVKSLAQKDSTMPIDSITIGILPTILKDSMDKHSSVADIKGTIFSPLHYIVDLLVKWSSGKDLPPSGSLYQITSEDNNVEILIF